MAVGFEKTLVFLIFIFLGALLKSKFKSPKEVNGVKNIILNLALPSTIFIALLGIDINASLLIVPLMALAFNILLFIVTPFLLPMVGINKNMPTYRTARILLPSLAPGLSCFPFVLEFLGEEYLAKAAMADLGNKVFVLIVLYLIAMHWYHARNQEKSSNGKAKLASLVKALITEPVNLFIGLALVLLLLGLNIDSLPFVLSETLTKLSLMMTPMVLLFIGLAVKIKKKQFFQIFSLLIMRAGLVFILVGTFVTVTSFQLEKNILLMLSFGLSACSFWPYSHISLVDSLEIEKKSKTFNNNYAIGILALSFPLSTLLILGVLNSGSFFLSPVSIIITGSIFVLFGLLYPLTNLLSKKVIDLKLPKPALKASKTD